MGARIATSLGCVLALVACGEQAPTVVAAAGGEPDASLARTPGKPLVGPPCAGLSCNVDVACPNGGTTSISGTVFDPAGRNPVPAVVYVPDDPEALPPIAPGAASCAACNPYLGTVGDYVTAAETNAVGAFTLRDAPTGKDIPLVIQLGKWRRVVTVDTTDCADTVVPASLARLPRNQSEGDVPQMAIVTGACDHLACLLSDIGLDPAEFTGPGGGGRVHVYKGAGSAPDLGGGGAGPAGDCSVPGCPLWSTKSALEKYDVVLLGCECGEHNETKPDLGPIHDWLGEGGRVLATHYQDTWFKNGPADFQGAATWLPSETDGPTPGPFGVDTRFANGLALRQWLDDAGALDPEGGVAIAPGDVSTSVSTVNGVTQGWIDDTSTTPENVKLLSFATPVGGVVTDAGAESLPSYCGRAMFTDIHAGGDGLPSSAAVPASCAGGPMTAEEKALEYAFFNLAGPCYLAPPQTHGVPPPL